MSEFKTTEALRKLLGMYDGVRIGHMRCHPSGYASVLFQVDRPAVLVRLAGCAQNANVAGLFWDSAFVKLEGSGYDDGPWYELRAEGNPPGSDLPTTAELLCGDMLGDLIRHGVIDEAQGQRLWADWSARKSSDE